MLEQGTKLKWKYNGGIYHIGGVQGEIYFLVNENTNKYFGSLTESEILEDFDIIEEEWTPKNGEKYFFLGDDGCRDWCTWNNTYKDHFRRDNLGICNTEAEVPMSYKSKK